MANAAAATAFNASVWDDSPEFAGPPGAPAKPERRSSRTADPHDDAYLFGPYRCQPAQRQLLEGDAPVRLGSRAFDILVALLRRHGELVSKDALIAEVWPDTTVEESNLRVHMTTLRRALRDHDDTSRFICTVPGRGYRFTAPVSRPADRTAPAAIMVAAPCVTGLPVALTPIFGRAEFIRTLLVQLSRQRLITIVGPGGIGKTRVAVAAAEALADAYPDGIRFVDLNAVASPTDVALALARPLGIDIGDRDPAPALIGHLKDRRMLLVIDNCEHVIERIAELVERVLEGTSQVHILATSREPLRSAGEWVRRLPPLYCPPKSGRLGAAEALAYPAVQLFVDRLSAGDEAMEFNDDTAPIVGDVCRGLDGIALAIELAAGRVEAFGIRGMAAQLDDPLRLLTGGRRTGEARHQTLTATLEWSHRMLSEPERALLRRLAIFPGEFTLSAACMVARAGRDSPDVIETIAQLVAKSLVIADHSEDVVRYRLLATTRVYALDKLSASGELDAIGRRHAAQAAGAAGGPL